MMFKSLDYVVKNIFLEKGETNDLKYAKYLQLAINGARELNYILPHNIKTVSIPYDSTKGYIDVPNECIMYTKIGIIKSGRLYLLGINNDIPHSYKTDDCGYEKRDPIIDDGVVLFYNYSLDGQIYSIYGYGKGRNNFGEYRYNRETNRIEFDGVLDTSEIYMEFKSSMIAADGTALIPDECISTLMEYVHWRDAKFSKSISVYDKERARKDWIASKKSLRRRVNPSIFELLDYAHRDYMQAPK